MKIKDTEKEKIFEFTTFKNTENINMIENNQIPQLKGWALKKNQIKAHLYKNLSFQLQQVSTNIFHFVGPFICIFLMWLTLYEIKKQFNKDYNFDKINGIPFYHNLPFSFFSKSAAYPVSANNCLKWFLYEDLRENNYHQKKEGFDEIKKDNSKKEVKIEDILKTQFYELCPKIKKSVPYFEKSKTGVNSEIFKTMKYLNSFQLKVNEEVQEIELLPDAGLSISSLSQNKIEISIQMNDLLFTEFHRDNGFSKMSFKIPKPEIQNFFDTGENLKKYLNNTELINKELIQKTSEQIYNKTLSKIERIKKTLNTENSTFPTVTATEGILNTIDLITKNYLALKNKKTKIVSSISYMDTISTTDLIFNSIIVLIIISILPLGVSSHFSLFLHMLVSEKEERTREMMVLHGMKMEFYYLVNYFYFGILSFLSSVFFVGNCYFFLDLELFRGTSVFVVFVVFALWAHSQVSLAFFVQNFPIDLKIATSLLKSFWLYFYHFFVDGFCFY